MNGLEEKDYAEALGVELPEPEPAAEPAADPADSADADVGTASGADVPAEDGGEDPVTDPNASAAARRRNYEERMEKRIEREREKARQEERARMIAEIKRANAAKAQTPPVNPSPAPAAEPARDSAGRFARRGPSQTGTDPAPADDLTARVGAMIDNHPAVKAAKEYTERMREAEVRSAFAEDLAKITEMDPSIQTEEDLLALPEHDLILGLVNKGYSPSDAYKSVFSEKIIAAAVERGKRQAASQAASTSHQVPDKVRGGEGIVVPSDIIAQYRQMFPGITDAEIAKHYAKYKTNQK